MAGRKDRSHGMGIASGWVPGNAAEDPLNRVLPRGSAVAAVPTDVAAQAIQLLPAIDPVQGQTVVLSNQTPVTFNGSQLTQLAYYTTRDQVPRKGTVIVAPNKCNVPGTHSISQNNGVYAKITQGTTRATISRWVGTPCVFPVEGSFVKVEGFIGQVPFLLSTLTTFSTQQAIPQPPADAQAWQNLVTCLVIDGWTDLGQPTQIWNAVPILGGGAANGNVTIFGPVLLESVTFTNTGSTAVLVAIQDSNGTLLNTAPAVSQVVYVPANQTVSVGADLLGPFGAAFNPLSITPPIPAAPTAMTIDTNGNNVLVSAWGHFLGAP